MAVATAAKPVPTQRTARQAPTPRASATFGRLGEIETSALKLWLMSKGAVLVAVTAGAWLLTSAGRLNEPSGFFDRWKQFDTQHYLTIAQFGYDGNPQTGPAVPLEAFFPGYPLLIRILHLGTGLDYVVAGMLISFVASGIALVALARIAALEATPGTAAAALAERTVLLFVLAPSAVFLTAAYTEAVFLAFALPAWLAAKRGNWAAAALLAAGASSIRITGLFLVVALVVEFLTARDGRRRWRELPWLAVAALPLVAYTVYLHDRTGDWQRWSHAQEEGWYKVFAWPWEGMSHSLGGVSSDQYTTDWAWGFRAEVIAAVVGLVLTVWLLHRRRWAEGCYVGLQLVALTTTYWWLSIPRSSLTWWPLWIALAAWSLRRPEVFRAYLAVLAPFMVLFAVAFTTGRWAG